MNAFYNDNEPYVAQWLRTLQATGILSPGRVDSGNIQEVFGPDLTAYDRCHFFAGIGGWDYALQLAGWPLDRPVWTGSCPCQPFSVAGKRKGVDDTRHVWPIWRELIKECMPPVIFGEQVASPDGRKWLAGVRADLEALGYAVGAADLCAAGVTAPHIRQRLYWVADSNGREPSDSGLQRGGQHGLLTAHGGVGGLGDPNHPGPQGRSVHAGEHSDQRPAGASGESCFWDDYAILPCTDGKARRIEPGTFPLAHGIPARVGKIRAYGNAIVPEVAATFIRAYLETREESNV